MREIKYIVVHCSLTRKEATIPAILNYWRTQLGWKNPGYHIAIDASGVIHELLSIEQVANGVKGYNANSVHVAYIGGLDAAGKPADTRTLNQQSSLINVLQMWRKKFPNAIIQGHWDFPKVTKMCPNFDAKKEYAWI